MMNHFLDPGFHSPSLNNQGTSVLWKVDNTVLSRSITGLRKILKFFSNYCQNKTLSINYNKIKVLIFQPVQNLYHWQIHGINQTGFPVLLSVDPISFLNGTPYLTFHKTNNLVKLYPCHFFFFNR